MELAVWVGDAVAIVDVWDKSNKSEKVSAEKVFAKTWFEVGEAVPFEMAYECKKK